MDPQEVFPVEVWEAIFERVKDPQDWLNLYRSSSFFEEGMAKERPLALFPQVFPLLLNHLPKHLQGILALRLVCRKWRESVDKRLETSEDSIAEDCGWNYGFTNSYPRDLWSFMDRFESHPGNPFIGRSVTLSYTSSGTWAQMTEFENLASRLLAKFGTHVKELKIEDFTEHGPRLHNYARRLRSCVQRTPNLEKLNVTVGVGGRLDAISIASNQSAMPPIETDEPLPIISNLKSLNFWGVCGGGILEGMVNVTVRMCCHPDTLKLVSIRGVGVPSELTAFPNLENVSSSFGEQDQICLRNSSWPLSQLHLFPQPSVSASWRDIALTVEHFKATLTVLRVDSWEWEIIEGNSENRCDLPHVKCLIVPLGLRFRNFYNLSNLETLGVTTPDPSFHGHPPVLKNKEFTDAVEREMTESNIWRELPKLKKIEARSVCEFMLVTYFCKVYARETCVLSQGDENQLALA